MERYRPKEKPARSDCLMVFEAEECAREFCARMTGGRLYSVELDDFEILHRGDMRIVNEIGVECGAGRCDTDRCKAYWRSEETAVPCIEISTASAVVVADLAYTQEERKRRIGTLFDVGRFESESPTHVLSTPSDSTQN